MTWENVADASTLRDVTESLSEDQLVARRQHGLAKHRTQKHSIVRQISVELDASAARLRFDCCR